MLDVPIANIFETLQVNLGTAYVNDFNAFGRVYQVRAQADQKFRTGRARTFSRLKVRSANGALVPLGTLVEIRDVTGPDLVQRYNLYTVGTRAGQRGARLLVGTGARYDGGSGPRRCCPRASSFEWTELAFQERQTGNLARSIIFALSVLFVFLVLAAQYESWSLPLAIILIVPMSILSALLGVAISAGRTTTS